MTRQGQGSATSIVAEVAAATTARFGGNGDRYRITDSISIISPLAKQHVCFADMLPSSCGALTPSALCPQGTRFPSSSLHPGSAVLKGLRGLTFIWIDFTLPPEHGGCTGSLGGMCRCGCCAAKAAEGRRDLRLSCVQGNRQAHYFRQAEQL